MDEEAKRKDRTDETRAGRAGEAERSRISPLKKGFRRRGESESMPYKFFSILYQYEVIWVF